MFPNVKEAHARRLKALLTDPMWEFNMVELLKRKYKNKIGKDRVVRIHSAGDFQNVTHLRKWCYIAEQTPDILYWAPSREALIIKSYLSKYDKFPDNFRLRVSNHMVNSHKSASNFPYMSSVITDIKYAKGDNICPATINGNDPTCDGNNCRKCWSTEKNINYLKH